MKLNIDLNMISRSIINTNIIEYRNFSVEAPAERVNQHITLDGKRTIIPTFWSRCSCLNKKRSGTYMQKGYQKQEMFVKH